MANSLKFPLWFRIGIFQLVEIPRSSRWGYLVERWKDYRNRIKQCFCRNHCQPRWCCLDTVTDMLDWSSIVESFSRCDDWPLFQARKWTPRENLQTSPHQSRTTLLIHKDENSPQLFRLIDVSELYSTGTLAYEICWQASILLCSSDTLAFNGRTKLCVAFTILRKFSLHDTLKRGERSYAEQGCNFEFGSN